ncbi:MAG: FimB/Mfa2 family fimbrial subunit [Proteiniphilum sp.]|jgi:hypothetical protein|nr:FimB/Mfa2 family fimbrial subunit [Proteiniphilum sp.]
MTTEKNTNTPLKPLCLLALAVSLTGCTDNHQDEYDALYPITVQACVSGSNTRLESGSIKDLSLFVFDRNYRFMYKIETGTGKEITIRKPVGESLHIVTWGNLAEGAQTLTEPKPGDRPDACLVELQPRVRTSVPPCAGSPGDLFRGEITLSDNERDGEKKLSIYREVGSMTVTLQNLENCPGYDDGNFRLTVHETHSMMNFKGELQGDMIAYLPAGSIDGKRYCTPPFNMFPGESVRISIHHGDRHIATVSADRRGEPITVERDRLTKVLIDLETASSVTADVEVAGWMRYEMEKEF